MFLFPYLNQDFCSTSLKHTGALRGFCPGSDDQLSSLEETCISASWKVMDEQSLETLRWWKKKALQRCLMRGSKDKRGSKRVRVCGRKAA